MCYSNCPYEDRDGECRLNLAAGSRRPLDAHCMDIENNEEFENNKSEPGEE